jgi:PhoPQ-activated pathogenicity-related protein
MSNSRISRPSVVVLLSLLAASAAGRVAGSELYLYVQRPDAAFAWKQTSNHTTQTGTIHTLELTSQVWQGITWKHHLSIYEPAELTCTDTVLLFVAGASTGFKPHENDRKMGINLTNVTGARVAVLYQVPNQPLLGGLSEDALIAETFVRYLETKDATWPLLFPMVKSAVRAMDAVQAWAKERGRDEVKGFVVTGGSKRGWTSWLTGAADRRVIAVAPMVIVMLNIGVQGPNQLEVWGKYSEQLEDYMRRGLMERAQTPEGPTLWKMVDPYSYRDRLRIPKLLINGTNDRYWTLNALDLYWHGLEGPKSLIELPNAGHALEQNQEWGVNGLGAFFRHVTTGRRMPSLLWTTKRQASGDLELSIQAEPVPISARLWTAEAKDRDFRESPWTSSALPAAATITTTITQPASGHKAAFADLQYQHSGLSYHLTTSFFELGIKAKEPAKVGP